MGDLCTLKDVLDEGDIDTDVLNDKIVTKITKLSDLIRFSTGISDLDITNLDARYCCIYGVLAWLEKRRM